MTKDSQSDKGHSCMTLTNTTNFKVTTFTLKLALFMISKTTSQHWNLRRIKMSLTMRSSMLPKPFGSWGEMRPFWLSKETEWQSLELSTRIKRSSTTKRRLQNSLRKWTLLPLLPMTPIRCNSMITSATQLTFRRSMKELYSWPSTNWATLGSTESKCSKSFRPSTVFTRQSSTNNSTITLPISL